MALPNDWSKFLAAIRAQESGGNYTEDTAGCLGAYCWSSMTTWGNMASDAGQGRYADVNPSQVPADVQDEVASKNLYRIYQQAGGGSGGLSAAARWWNGGSTTSEANPGLPPQAWAPHCGSGSSGAYACQVLTRMGLGGHYIAGAGSGAGGVVSTTAASLTAEKQAAADCLYGLTVPGANVASGVVGDINNFFQGLWGMKQNQANPPVEICLLTKSQARGVVGVASMAAGAIIAGLGLALIFKATAPQALLRLALSPTGLLSTAATGARAGAGAEVASQRASASSAAAAADREGAAADALYNREQRRRARSSSVQEPLPDIPRRGESSRQRARRYTAGGTAASPAEAGF